MSVKELSKDQVNEISMIELATIILEEEREAIDFNEIFHRIAKLKGFTEAEKEQYIAQFYTDMNIDGGFMTIGTNRWGLKKWYPVEQMEEEIANLPQKRKKKKKKPSKLLEDELGVSEYNNNEEDDLEEDVELTDEDLDLDDDDDYDGDYEEDDLDEEEEEIVEDDVSFVGDEDEEDDK
ncbi:DNA-directed RNA polymerase subunit delta [Halobacillus halophilus]|uniref:Probable DNA-directed RNA polymerase subunit delta n=1 Tax=Halobacillus halophilus (strain ATCC 35676 / DSM 2266 / JCM 20832 / KCTC 3685 / LMG 17431 / NBRC 102448 / NCIMB 2269) TaxID=866895 RepID=I0JS51_HALH3|nr:DNA-directed RNA polymerase subunit delta [Halobacillus halophilus]ASF40914.1 DNA-directed RNA polymerase subunit delta [Halobacillus halophilus]CCG46972.1 DNA-directed RNA polymerase delta subunit [Halobacillus halophilus DSM 2266]